MKHSILVVFDVDGSLADCDESPNHNYDEKYLLSRPIHRNMAEVVRHYLKMPNVELVFITGRPKSVYRVTWQWLNKHLQLAASGKRVSLVCRPDSEPHEKIAACKLHEVVQAIRRVGSKPVEAFIYDDQLSNLRLFESLRPMVANLRLFKVEDDVATAWSL